MTISTERLREMLAAHLCDEYDVDFYPAPGAQWPEDENDDGRREGGYVAIQPKHVQARAREMADRILAFLSTRSSGAEGREAVIEECAKVADGLTNARVPGNPSFGAGMVNAASQIASTIRALKETSNAG